MIAGHGLFTLRHWLKIEISLKLFETSCKLPWQRKVRLILGLKENSNLLIKAAWLMSPVEILDFIILNYKAKSQYNNREFLHWYCRAPMIICSILVHGSRIWIPLFNFCCALLSTSLFFVHLHSTMQVYKLPNMANERRIQISYNSTVS